jgi:hypothetical protein
LSILENPLDIAPHEKPVYERATARTIADKVTAERPAMAFFEGVRVMPQGIGAAQLNVHELVWRIPLGDFRAPADGKTVNGDAIINQGAGPHDDGGRREDFELQPARRDDLQVAGFGEEGKDLAPRPRKV